MKDFRIISSSRAYMFAQDTVRLSAIATPEAHNLIVSRFAFQSMQVAALPGNRFGELPATVPPGLVGVSGRHVLEDGSLIPIRYIAIEAQRVTVEIASPSAFIDPVFDMLRTACNELQLAAGGKAIGDPIGSADQSDATAKLERPLSALLPTAAARLLASAADSADEGASLSLSLSWRCLLDQGRRTPGLAPASLEPRIGTTDEDGVTFSSVFLESEAHHAYLQELERTLSGATG